MLARDAVHRPEYAAFLSLPFRQSDPSLDGNRAPNPPQDLSPALSYDVRFRLRLRASFEEKIGQEFQRFFLRLPVWEGMSS